MELRNYQQQAVEEIRYALSKYRRVLFQLPTGGGKCLGVDTPVLMYDGSVKKVQDVVAGDLLMGPDSCPRRVESTCRGRETMYRVVPDKGDSFTCNESHILSLRYTGSGKVSNISIKDYLSLSDARKRSLKMYRSGVEFPDRPVATDPYVLGLRLADGDRIPKEYLINSTEKRMLLLAGLLEGRGFSKCGFGFTTRYPALRDDVLYLCRSLGFAAYASTQKVDSSKMRGCVSADAGDYYRISISGNRGDASLNTGFVLENIGEGDYYGFEISGNDRLFLLGDFTVTHNTVIFSYIAMSSQRFNRKVLILSSRTEILEQNGSSLERMGLDVQYINPRFKGIPSRNVCCGMAQTLKRRLEKPEWKEWLKTIELCIVDECHEQTPDFIYDYLSDKCFVLGCTATPRRYGHQRQLGELFRAMVTGVTVKELIGQGFLAKAHHYSVVAPKMDDVPIDYKTCDYNQKAMAAKFENRKLYSGIVDEFLRICPSAKAIFFCCSSKQAIGMTEELNKRGVDARYLLSGTFDSDSQYSGKRSELIDDFKAGRFQVLVNVGIAIAGFDDKTVQAVVLNYSTISLTKYLQSIGRGSRVTDGKSEFIILDAGENYRKHGAYDSDRTWSLWHDTRISQGEPMLKLCDHTKKDVNGRLGCDTWVPVSCSYCPKCGFKFMTEKDVYQLHLEEIASAEEESVKSFCAKKKLEGWSTNRILIQVLLANSGREHEAFLECCETLGLKPTYWFAFKKHVWSKIRTKQSKIQ